MMRWTFTLSGLLVCSCNSTGVGNPPVIPEFETQALAITVDAEDAPSDPDDESTEKVGLLGRTELTSAALLFSEIRYLACDGSTRSEPGPFVVDLVKNSVSPDLPLVRWPESGLCGIDAVFGVAAQPDFLAGYSIVLVGNRSEGDTFITRVAMSGSLPLRPRGEQRWQASEHAWLWALRPRHWFAEEELNDTDETENAEGASPPVGTLDAGTAAPAEPKPTPRLWPLTITSERHTHLYLALKQRLGAHTTLHVDENDNLELDTVERTGKTYIGRGQGIEP